MDPFRAPGQGIILTAEPDDSVYPDGTCLTIRDNDSGNESDIILDPNEARELAAWILAAVPPVDHSPGRYCAICRHSGGEGPYLWCNHPVATHIDPILGKPVGQTASYMRACARPCGPAGKLFEPIEPPAPAAD